MPNAALEHCKLRIQRRLGWGDPDDWTTQDFEELSVRIQEETGRAISATTLKRIWGRVAYHSSPSRHSLDTLAEFAGYPSWRDLAHAADREAPPSATPVAVPAGVTVPVRPRTGMRLTRSLRYLAIPALLLSLGLVAWVGLNGASGEAAPAEVVFRSRPVASGVPNTVIFEYDVGGVEADSFSIQQSWDQRRRARIAPERQTYTSIYYRPGFFNAKLLADDRVLAEHPLHVTTDGWVALIEAEPTPIYLSDAFSASGGALAVAPTWLQAHGHDAAASYQVLEYYNVRAFGAVRTSGFSLEAALRRTVDGGRYACGRAEVAILGERGAFQVPLGAPGCVGELGLLLGMRYLEGAANDLSAFGVDLSTWQRVRLDVAAGEVRIQAGTNAPFVAPLDGDVGRVVGLRFRFEGAGAVDYVVLRGADGAVVYEEAF